MDGMKKRHQGRELKKFGDNFEENFENFADL